LAARRDIEILPSAREALAAVADKKVLREIAKTIDGLSSRPETQGKVLTDPLEGVRSLRAARERYRVLFEIDAETGRVQVLFVGLRRPGRPADVYRIAARLLRRFTSTSTREQPTVHTVANTSAGHQRPTRVNAARRSSWPSARRSENHKTSEAIHGVETTGREMR
jgi:mRNA interferase RelE/StbE